MKRIFYADVYFILNVMVNFSLITLTAWMRKKPWKFFRYVSISVLTAGCSTAVICFFGNQYFLLVLSAIPEILIMLGASFSVRKVSEYGKDFFCLLFLTVFMGGMITALYNLCRGFSFVHSFWWLCFSFLLFLSASFFLRREVFLLLTQRRGTMPVILQHGEKRVEAAALYDTGNKLYSPYTGEGVTVIAKSAAERLEYEPEHYQLIPYHSLGGDGILQAFYIDAIEMKGKGEKKEHVLVAVSDSFHKSEGIEVILNVN